MDAIFNKADNFTFHILSFQLKARSKFYNTPYATVGNNCYVRVISLGGVQGKGWGDIAKNQNTVPYFFVYKTEFFSFQNNPKDLDSSYKMDLDLLDCLGRVKLAL